MNNKEEIEIDALIKRAHFTSDFDIIIEYIDLSNKKSGKFQMKKSDFSFDKPGMDIVLEMTKLKDLWNNLSGKKIKIKIIRSDEMYFSKKDEKYYLNENNIDLNPDQFEENFNYSDSDREESLLKLHFQNEKLINNNKIAIENSEKNKIKKKIPL